MLDVVWAFDETGNKIAMLGPEPEADAHMEHETQAVLKDSCLENEV